MLAGTENAKIFFFFLPLSSLHFIIIGECGCDPTNYTVL